jgi:murein peptide amidase A
LGPAGVSIVTTYEALVQGWKNVSEQRSFRFRQLPTAVADRSLMIVEIGPSDAPVVHLTAGVHGDEPAGPWALLSIVESGLLDPRFAYRIWPCTNPSGYQAGTRGNLEGNDVNRSFSEGVTTPESRAIIQVNRDHHFVVAVDLHEDFEADGFYCYEPVIHGTAPLSEAIVRAIESAGFPVQTLDEAFDLGYPRDSRKAEAMRTLARGRVLVNASAEIRLSPGLPLSLYLLRSAVKRYVTVETPRRRSWDDRIAMHRLAVVTALAEAALLLAKAAPHA